MFWWWIEVYVLAASVSGFDIMAPHPTRCNMFYQLDSCPLGLLFNPVRQMCDLPARANCNGGITERFESSTRMVLAYPSPDFCEMFYRLTSCPEGLNFNPQLKVCDFVENAGCVAECPSLSPGPGMLWYPETCISGSSKIGTLCSASCATKDYQLKGSDSLTCTEAGWNSTQGLNVIPKCMTPVDLVQDVVDTIANEVKGLDAGLLFVMDESGSITAQNFPKEVTFIKALVSAFPLSTRRSAGVILFSSQANVVLSLQTSDTCTFLKNADGITYHGGGTDILLALNTAIQEISTNAVHKKNLVLLITDGQSADPTAAADTLKNNGNILFTLGVAGYDKNILESIASVGKSGAKLFYGITDFAAFDAVATHLETTYLNGTQHNCP